jgi:copper chaperone NosL
MKEAVVTRISRLLTALSGLSLLLLFLLPLWRIGLGAPQYPEGLGMNIWINRITGDGPNDLQNINGLNHYIGMHPILPEGIPELRIFPWVVVGLAATGLAVALWGRRPPLFAWGSAFVVFALVGLYDFYRWEYQYGHDLDPSAAIKIPGASYQPPLIGSRQILNFVASSWPAPGGWIAILAGLTVVGVMVYELRRNRTPGKAAVHADASWGRAPRPSRASALAHRLLSRR